jgi:uncharacterized repeat protein (TIGR03837 family)
MSEPSEPFATAGSRWDVFCNVIDNLGDIGVCWRLARQLAAEYGFEVRLWVDALESLRQICPEIDPARPSQRAHGVKIRRWPAVWLPVPPADVVIEAFGCRLPHQFEEAMAARTPAPVWINLEYLSAEPWVEGFHAHPSPHPRLPLVKYVFLPGFTEATGGLLRERDLEERRRAFLAGTQGAFWADLGLSPPVPNELYVSLFSYENPAIASLLDAWANSARPVCCLLPLSRNLPQAEAFAGKALHTGDVVRRGNLRMHVLPFLAQPAYDRLLWACNLNFVRGEDSFVRAQWAAQPLVWHIYPQQGDAHLPKLNAFVDRYCAAMPEADAQVVRQSMLAWNNAPAAAAFGADLWERWLRQLPSMARHAEDWREDLCRQDNLCRRLVRFCGEKRAIRL